jgi:hypothetical protein
VIVPITTFLFFTNRDTGNNVEHNFDYIFCETGLMPRVVSTWIALVVATPIVDILNIKPILCYLVNVVVDKTRLKNYLTQKEANK